MKTTRIILVLLLLFVSVVASQGQYRVDNAKYRAYAECETIHTESDSKPVWTMWADSRAKIEVKDGVLTVADSRYVINQVNYTTVVNGRKRTEMFATGDDGISYIITLAEYDKKKRFQLKINSRIRRMGSAYMMIELKK